jgi:hypothetical protein
LARDEADVPDCLPFGHAAGRGEWLHGLDDKCKKMNTNGKSTKNLMSGTEAKSEARCCRCGSKDQKNASKVKLTID